ncbi:MAG: hypothetical protein QG574_760 [Cyanobacteriota bacterium erpe_2018_sw_21hr_WHONDRS-SW48-000092_B_bin.40]|nr:hypothetical protein [Cyanobacteriota bacterium erpe_2018_sw_21hr_WHONDRS-SW48-000092_B_bin.40]
MSNRAKFLVPYSAQLPANQKSKFGMRLFQSWAVVFIAAAYLGVVVVPVTLLLAGFSYSEVRITPPPALEPSGHCVHLVPSKALNVNLVTEQAEQNTEAVAQNVEQQLWPDFGACSDICQGGYIFWSEPEFSVPDYWFVATGMIACGVFALLQMSKVQQSLRFIRRRIAFQLGFTSRGGSAAFRNRRKGQISYLTKHFFDRQLVRIALCLLMITPFAAVFCLSESARPMQSAIDQQSLASTNWLAWRVNQSKYSDFVGDWQASPYGNASAAAHLAHVDWSRVCLHVASVLWAIFTEWRLVVPIVLLLLLFRSARQAKVTGQRSSLKQNLRQLSQYFVPVVHRFLPAKQGVRQVASATVLQISGKQQRFAQWKIKIKQRAVH